MGKLAGSSAERSGLIPQVLGDIAAFAYTKFVGSAPLRHLELVTRIASAPERDSRVTLVRDRDALGLRKAKLTWALNPIDRRSVVRSLELVGAAVGAAGLGRLQILVDEDDRKWPEDLAGGWHHMGTTRMSDDPAPRRRRPQLQGPRRREPLRRRQLRLPHAGLGHARR